MDLNQRASSSSPIRIAINGYGRIGQCVLRALYESVHRNAIQIVAINELSDIDTIAYLTRYDSTHGRFPLLVETSDSQLLIDGDAIEILREEDPTNLPWTALEVDVVLECTGVYGSRADAERHLHAGAKRVLFSHPAESDVDRTVVFGVNDSELQASDRIVSNASCTTNAIVPVLKTLHQSFGVEAGNLTTIHSAMNDQPTIDAYHHRDLRRTRSAMQNLVPVDTALAKGVERLLPELRDKLSAVAMRVPTVNVSALDLSVYVSKATSREEVNEALSIAAQNQFKGVLAYTQEPLASTDFNHDSRSAIVDGSQTRVTQGKLVKVLTWFDNEWGFANRMLDVTLAWFNRG